MICDRVFCTHVFSNSLLNQELLIQLTIFHVGIKLTSIGGYEVKFQLKMNIW